MDGLPTSASKTENDFITCIHAKNIVSGLARIPAGFYAVIDVDGEITKTSEKPVLTNKDMVEWDEEIHLPEERTSIISIELYGCFEVEPTLALLHRFKMTVGDTLDCNAELRAINCSDSDVVLSSRSSIRFTTERRSCDVNGFAARRELSELDARRLVQEFTDSGYHALLRYRQLHDHQDLYEAITFFERGRDICPASDHHRSTVLFNLATARFIHCQDIVHYHDLDVSIELYRDAFHLPARSHSGCYVTALELFFAFLPHLQTQANIADGTRVEDSFSKVTATYAYQAAWLALQMVGISVSVRLINSWTSEAKCINPDMRLIWTLRAHLRDMSYQDPRRPAALASLGMSLFCRYEGISDHVESHEAISTLEYALQIIPNSPAEAPLFGFLGNSLYRRFERLGDTTDLDKAISARQVAARLFPGRHPDRPILLNQLGSALCYRFRRLGNSGDIEESILIYEEALNLIPNDHAAKPILWINLGTSLTHRFEHFGEIADVDRSISMTEDAIRLRHGSNGYHDKPDWFYRLGNSYLHRFRRLANLTDISNSISSFEGAIDLTPDDDCERADRLTSLGNALSLRFEHLGKLTDIAKSILVSEEAIRLTRDDNPEKPNRLANLGKSLFRRFERLGDLPDLDKSISMHEAATCLTPDGHPEKASRLNNLGTSLTHRFQLLGDIADINKSISVFEEANYLTPNGQPQKPEILNSLGTSLICRFHRLGELADIDRSTAILWESIFLTPDGHPRKPDRWNNLLRATCEHFHPPSDLSTATSDFPPASHASTSRSSRFFRAARQWVSSSGPQGNSRFFLDSCITAIDFLPLLASDGLPLRARHRVLLETVDIARDAAAVAIDAGFPEVAVEFLEKGRSIVWNQTLQLRTPVDELHDKYPGLADEFQRTSQAMEHASCRENYMFHELVNDLICNVGSLEQEYKKIGDLALKRHELVVKIRSLPGFDQFLIPKKLEQLAALAYSGPVVYLNASEQRCDALIVRAESKTVFPVPLPGINSQDMSAFQKLLHLSLERDCLVISRSDISALIPAGEDIASHLFLSTLLTDDGIESLGRGARVKPQQIWGYTPECLFKRILASLWTNVVKPVLDALHISTPMSDVAEMDRIFWCPTGPFTFLPIHAAGLYDTDEAGTKLSDFAISSYIPSLSALGMSSGERGSRPSSDIHLVAVPQPPSDGHTVLSFVEEEMGHIRTLSAKSPFVTLEESNGCIEDIMEKMKNADWVHFACHGMQDPLDPLSSGLCLADGRRLKLSDIILLSRPRGGLAFLSACQTAQGDETLPEESAHLGAGMLLAGYRSVIATIWAIRDPDAPKVTKDVYEHLFRDGKVPDCADAARALHYAVQRLRASGASFASWVPFIHIGR